MMGTRALLALALGGAAACGPSNYSPPGDLVLRCPIGEPTTRASLTISHLVVNGITLAASFDPAGTYNETETTTAPSVSDTAASPGDSGAAAAQTVADAAACYDAATQSASVIFEVAGVDFGRIHFRSGGELGNLDLLVDDPVTLQLYRATPPGLFHGTDFVDGTYYVDSLLPLAIDLVGNAASEGRQLSISASVEVSP